MTININGFQGEIPIVDAKALLETSAVKAVNCDFRSGTLKSLPTYLNDVTVSSKPEKIFLLASTDWTTIKILLAGQNFYALPAPVINTSRSVFVFAGTGYTGPKKATLSDIDTATTGSSGLVYREGISDIKDLGVQKPSSPLEIQKIATFTDYLTTRVYYEDDVFHVQDNSLDSAFDYYLFICIVDYSVGDVSDNWDNDKSLSNFTVIPWFSEIPTNFPSKASSHDKEWIFDESGGGQDNWSKNTGDKVIGKGDLVHYKDGAVYQAKFDYINRNRPDDPSLWTFLVDLSDFMNAVSELDDYNIRYYDSSKVYSKYDMVLKSYGQYDNGTSQYTLYFYFFCNVEGTQGVDPIDSLATGTHKWAPLCLWHDSDAFGAKGTTVFDDSDGWVFTTAILNEDGTTKESSGYTILPYITTYPGSKNPWYALYRYINAEGNHKYGIFQTNGASSNVRPFNPEWGEENPWEVWKSRDEVKIDRSEVYDTVVYTWTWVTAWGEESAPADPTEVIDARIAEKVQFKTPVATVPDSHIVGFRVYRLSSGFESAEYLLFQNSDFGTGDLGTWKDDVNDAYSHIKPAKDLVQEVLQTEGWDEPDSALTGFVSLANGCIAGFKDNAVYFSEPYVYYAFPSKYQLSAHANIRGLAAFGNTLIVCTLAHTEVINCPLPGQASQVVSPHPQPCYSAASIVSAENFVLYAGHDGLVRVDESAVATTITQSIIAIQDWEDTYQPSKIAGAYYEGYYWGVITGTTDGFILDPRDPSFLIRFDASNTSLVSLTGIDVDPYFGLLFLFGENSGGTYDVLVFNYGSSTFSYEWQSKTFRFGQYVSHAAVQVDGDQDTNSSIKLVINVDGAQHSSLTLTDSDPHRLPAGKYRELNFTLSGSAEVFFVKFVYSPSEL